MLLRHDQNTIEAYKLYFIAIAIILFIVSAFTSCEEVRYFVGGKTQDAAVVKMQNLIRRSRSSSTQVVNIAYSLTEADNSKRQESDEVTADWLQSNLTVLADDNRTIAIEYLPGAPEYSRIAGHTRRWVMIPFLLTCALLAFVSIRFLREFNAHQRRMNAQRG